MAATLMKRDGDDDRSDFPGPTSTIKGLTGTRFGNRKVLQVVDAAVFGDGVGDGDGGG